MGDPRPLKKVTTPVPRHRPRSRRSTAPARRGPARRTRQLARCRAHRGHPSSLLRRHLHLRSVLPSSTQPLALTRMRMSAHGRYRAHQAHVPRRALTHTLTHSVHDTTGLRRAHRKTHSLLTPPALPRWLYEGAQRSLILSSLRSPLSERRPNISRAERRRALRPSAPLEALTAQARRMPWTGTACGMAIVATGMG